MIRARRNPRPIERPIAWVGFIVASSALGCCGKVGFGVERGLN